MAHRSRELEFLLLALFVVIPMYGEADVANVALLAFQLSFAAIIGLYVVARREPGLPAALMQGIAIAYLVFFPVDLFVVSRSLIRASTHLLLFIGVWQALDRVNRGKFTQRMLVVALLFVASMATSTSVLMVPYAVVFFLLLYRQMIQLGHEQTLSSLGRGTDSHGVRKAAWIYLIPAGLAAMLLFPMLPRLQNSLVQGIVPALSDSTTGLSTSIDFNEMRNISPDQTTISRISMPTEAVPFFTPVRLRGEVYDSWEGGQWKASEGVWNTAPSNGAAYRIRRGSGVAPIATVEQRLVRGVRRLYLPEQTFRVIGMQQLSEREGDYVFRVPQNGSIAAEFKIQMAWRVEPLVPVAAPPLLDYPLSSEVIALSNQVTAGHETTHAKSNAIERYLFSEYTYVQNPADLGRPLSVDEFLLRERRGHCEYFAAGMVVLLRAQGIPARIVGGFYGGKLNPLTGQWVLSFSDAHAWVEVWDAGVWKTFDPTPPDQRPGTAADGLFRAYVAAVSDWVTYVWDRYVLTFGMQDQVDLLIRAIGSAREAISSLRLLVRAVIAQPRYLIGVAMVAIAFLLLPGMLRRSRPRSIGERFAVVLARAGVEADPSLTFREMLTRLSSVRPDLAPVAEEIVQAGERELFAANGLSRNDRQAVMRRLRELRSMI